MLAVQRYGEELLDLRGRITLQCGVDVNGPRDLVGRAGRADGDEVVLHRGQLL
jgi:hypothetical protein